MHVTLNFLSPQKKAVLRAGFLFAFAQTVLFFFFTAIAFCSGLLLALRMMLRSTEMNIVSQASGSDRDSKAVTEEIKKVNDYLTRHDGYVKAFGSWSKTLTDITALVPAGIQLRFIHIDPGGKIEIGGHARKREDVLELRTRLLADKNVKGVVAPLSNILQQKDVDFTFSMSMTNPPSLISAPDPKSKRKR